MSDNPNSTPTAKRATRPWYRLHLSTCVVLFLLATGLVLVIVPGESHSLLGLETHVHGWPWMYLERIPDCSHLENTSAALTPQSFGEFGGEESLPGWLTKRGWAFCDHEVEFGAKALLLDLLVAMVILMVVGLAFEWRRRRYRRLWQCSLRELLLVMLVVAALLGWWQTENERYREEMRIWGELDDLSCSLNTTYLGPMWLPKLVGHRRLPILGWIGHDPFVCWRPEHPGLLHAVTVASFGCTPRLDPIEPRFGDDMLRRASPYLNRLKHLESVVIIGYEIDDGASVLAGLRRLRSLCISGGELGNAGIVHVGRLTRLRALAIAGTGITNGALAALGNCRSLEILDLSDTQVTDAGLVHLGSLANLRELNLALTNVTDAALVHLKQLEGLRDLDLTHTPVTKEGMDRLRRAIPGCRVHRSDSP